MSSDPASMGVIAPDSGNVVKTCIEALLHHSTTSKLGPLAKASLTSQYSFFESKGHSPSRDMWEALAASTSVLERMSNNDCPPRVYLSSLDPGVGKTQAIVHFLRSLLASPEHRNVGVLVCIGRLDEVEALTTEVGLSQEDFAVLTSNKEINGLGNAYSNTAQVLFTTHAMVESRSRGLSFTEADELWFAGRPRSVRIWDEAMLPGRSLTLKRDDIAALRGPLRLLSPDLGSLLDDLDAHLRSTNDKERLKLPELEAVTGVALSAAHNVLETESHKLAATKLWALSGKTVTVRQDGRFGSTILDYEETLPPDLAPVLVFDASGRVRETYSAWEKYRGGIVRLPSAPKSYQNLSTHVWETGGGKSAFRVRFDRLVEGIANTVNSKPHEEWLIVHHKSGVGGDFVKAVRALLDNPNQVIHFINWGRHDSTNLYSHVSNVILAGTLFYPQSHYEALGRAASKTPSSEGPYSSEKTKQIEQGEHRHLILQAACRASVRRCLGDQCAPCDLYVIASKRSGIGGALEAVFPDCQIDAWKPIARPLNGKVRMAFEFVLKALEDAPSAFVPFADVQQHIGIGNNSNFRNDVRKHPDFLDALDESGVIETGPGRYMKGFQKAFHFHFPDTLSECSAA